MVVEVPCGDNRKIFLALVLLFEMLGIIVRGKVFRVESTA
jgi:hypothetical protein